MVSPTWTHVDLWHSPVTHYIGELGLVGIVWARVKCMLCYVDLDMRHGLVSDTGHCYLLQDHDGLSLTLPVYVVFFNPQASANHTMHAACCPDETISEPTINMFMSRARSN